MAHNDMKPLSFIGTARKDLKKFPQTVRDDVGFDLYEVQRGKTPETAKPLKGFPGVMELVERYRKDTYRAVYITKIGGVVYVLHCFKKKSKRGIKTPKEDIDLIRQRLRLAQEESKGGTR
ncbi:MAG TPA: type II toxin-antitoxin system RelE/ParE family toxin [Nitrospirae bacterium]|nr:type II toxin-antitoxin system RelE/ParE family toxin [Nitrospirota bacterium]